MYWCTGMSIQLMSIYMLPFCLWLAKVPRIHRDSFAAVAKVTWLGQAICSWEIGLATCMRDVGKWQQLQKLENHFAIFQYMLSIQLMLTQLKWIPSRKLLLSLIYFSVRTHCRRRACETSFQDIAISSCMSWKAGFSEGYPNHPAFFDIC